MLTNQEILAQKRVSDFLDNELRGFVIGDLERLRSLSPQGTAPYTCLCTVPESLAVFSVMELMGFLMRSDFSEEQGLHMTTIIAAQTGGIDPTGADKAALDTLRKNRIDDTFNNIKYIMENWFRYDNSTIQVLISLFRHGGAHRFFPKAAGIGKWNPGDPVLCIDTVDGFPFPRLNEARLCEDYLTTNEKIADILRNCDDAQLQQITGEQVGTLALRMDARLDVLLYLDRQKLKNIFESQVDANFLTTTTTTTTTSTLPPDAKFTSISGGDYMRWLKAQSRS